MSMTSSFLVGLFFVTLPQKYVGVGIYYVLINCVLISLYNIIYLMFSELQQQFGAVHT